ncbi:patatin-like phospholipase family protein [Azospirillum sp. Marseille-Q6669]
MSRSAVSGPEPSAVKAPPSRRRQEGPRIVLVLGGGNALGAYHAGAYEQLHSRGVQPDWIIGASIGAITGAILAGNPHERRLERLRQFWREATLHTSGLLPHSHAKARQVYNGAHAVMATLFGRPSIFRHRFPGLWSVLPWVPNDVALYDQSPLRDTLERLIDFDLLNRAEVRFSAGCIDIETGDEVYFDSSRDEIRPEHIMASAAITPAFPPVEIGGRLFCDPGYTNNLPLDLPFTEPLDRNILCFAVELFSLRSARPASLDAVLERTNDLLFASHARRSVQALQREFALRERIEPEGATATLIHMAYQAASHELAAKGFDFSPSSIADRWAAGRRDMDSGLALLDGARKDTHRFRYAAVDSEVALAAAEGGAAEGGAAP